MISDNPIKVLEDLIKDISRDTYTLTRDDIDSIEWRLRAAQDHIRDIYKKRGKEML